MSNQESHNQDETKEADVEKRRRFIKGAGIAAPVILSLANRSAFGGELGCLSQQVSGNYSHTSPNGSCASGYSPSIWQAPTIGSNVGDITLGTTTPLTISTLTRTVKVSGQGAPEGNCTLTIIYPSVSQKTYNWHGTTYSYGLLTTSTLTITLTYLKEGNSNPVPYGGSFTIASVVSPSTDTTPTLVGKTLTTGSSTSYIISGTSGVPIRKELTPYLYSDFTGGTTFHDAFGSAGHDPSTLTTTSMREILSLHLDTLDAYCVTALLNAAYTPHPSPPYVLTVGQAIGLCKLPPDETLPPNTSLTTFLTSTW